MKSKTWKQIIADLKPAKVEATGYKTKKALTFDLGKSRYGGALLRYSIRIIASRKAFTTLRRLVAHHCDGRGQFSMSYDGGYDWYKYPVFETSGSAIYSTLFGFGEATTMFYSPAKGVHAEVYVFMKKKANRSLDALPMQGWKGSMAMRMEVYKSDWFRRDWVTHTIAVTTPLKEEEGASENGQEGG